MRLYYAVYFYRFLSTLVLTLQSIPLHTALAVFNNPTSDSLILPLLLPSQSITQDGCLPFKQHQGQDGQGRSRVYPKRQTSPFC